MKTKFIIVILFGIVFSGCVGVSSKGIFGTGVTVAFDPRTVGTQMDDSIMQKNLTARILLKDKNYLLSVKSKVLDGRIFMTGFCGTACVSEYTPALDLIFKNKEVPIFRDENECLKIIQGLLINKDKLNDLSERFYNSCKKFEDSFIINNINK